MIANRSIVKAIPVLFCSAFVLCTGCGSSGGGGAGAGNVLASPRYQGGAQAVAAANKQSVKVEVVDARTSKPGGAPASSGREVIAEGDKGKVLLDKPLTQIVSDAVAAGLRDGGFTVSPDAKVIVEVDIVDLPVQAWQFTHWNLPSERASTLDAFGAVLPGPIRETRAKAAFNIVIRKNEARLGFSHVVTGEAANKSKDAAIVEQTLNQAITQAVNQAVAQAGPDVEVVTRTPVSLAEIDAREQEILKQQKAIQDLSDALARRESANAEDHKAMEDMRKRLDEDRRDAQTALADQQKTLDEKRAAAERERDELKARVAELEKKPAEDPAAKEALADAKKRQADAETKFAEVTAALTNLETQKKSLGEREKNLAAYAAKLDDQAKANQAMSAELTNRQKELAQRESALTGWKADVEARVAKRPPEQIVAKQRPVLLITEPAEMHTETTLDRIHVSGVAIDDRKIANLTATLNGEPIDLSASKLLAAADSPGIELSFAARPINFSVPLNKGNNEIVITATDDDNLTTTQKLQVRYDRGAGRIHIISIGINDYQNSDTVPPLQYAVSDAKEVADAFEHLVGTPDPRVRELINAQATRANFVRQLFEQLPTEVGPADTVLIFFSGHGAPDTMTDSRGNVETFLLPIDADPNKLFATAIRMKDVATMLRRLRSERIVFIADTCYSGNVASGVAGARTVALPGVAMKAGVRAVFDTPKGKGVAMMTASSGIQVAQEKADVHHGVFTYYVLQGLRGAADSNHDGYVTVSELFQYVRDEVSKATGGKQTPQLDPTDTAGEIVLSRVKK